MKVGDFCKTGAGGTPLKSNRSFYEGGKIPWLLSGEVGNRDITETKKFITQEGLDGSSAKLFPVNTVLIAMYGATAGEVGILRCEASTNQAVCGILPNEKVLPEYLYYFFLNHKDLLIAQAVGNAQPNISQLKIKNTEVPLPSIPEQKRIVALLDTVFADLEQTRAKTEQNLKNARELFDSYLQQVFSQKGEGWVDVPLGNICNFKHGFAFKSEFFVDKSNLVLLTPGSFFEDGGYRDREEKTKYYKGEFPEEYLLSKGDLLVAMTEQAVGLLGSSALVPENDTFLHNQRLGLVELTPEYENKVNLAFLFHLFNTKHFRAKVQETASGLKVRHTSPKKMQVISVPLLTDLAAQEAIAQKLFEAKERVIELELIYQQKLNSIDELKKSILQKAFSGKLTHD
ncbi:restriction endonuclease subunit S [Shewanella kaireitica]|uniref:restriction endonuclease subunit S n=1 Tax=Shewanella kaireitica TaxID=212021 RepID=UPI00200FB9FF|nr:restriction endonuclease subunit S [Shewanella kaireitica]MCL1092794.1 restriction endonuclease subunit S [Shewanella kaireitica]